MIIPYDLIAKERFECISTPVAAAVTLSNGNEALDERASYFRSFKLNECVSAPSILLGAAIICGLLFAGIAVFISTPPPPDFFVVAPAPEQHFNGGRRRGL